MAMVSRYFSGEVRLGTRLEQEIVPAIWVDLLHLVVQHFPFFFLTSGSALVLDLRP